jgi:hypothetical protein
VTPEVFAASIAETLRRDRPDFVIVATSTTPTRYPSEYFAPVRANPALSLVANQVVRRTRLEQYRVAPAANPSPR